MAPIPPKCQKHMEVVWKTLVCTDDRFSSIRWELSKKFWRRRKSIREITGPCFSKNERLMMLPYLEGKIKTGNKTMLVKLYLLPRSKFNLMLGTYMTYGAHAETALVFTDGDFVFSKSSPSKLKKVIEKHIEEIQAEVDKRLNGEWLYLDEEEQKKIVWEDQEC